MTGVLAPTEVIVLQLVKLGRVRCTTAIRACLHLGRSPTPTSSNSAGRSARHSEGSWKPGNCTELVKYEQVRNVHSCRRLDRSGSCTVRSGVDYGQAAGVHKVPRAKARSIFALPIEVRVVYDFFP